MAHPVANDRVDLPVLRPRQRADEPDVPVSLEPGTGHGAVVLKPRLRRGQMQDGAWAWRCEDMDVWGAGQSPRDAYAQYLRARAYFWAKALEAAFQESLVAAYNANLSRGLPTFVGQA